jgi:hypothetical protein
MDIATLGIVMVVEHDLPLLHAVAAAVRLSHVKHEESHRPGLQRVHAAALAP